MLIEVLVTTVNNEDIPALINKMNIQSNSLVGNQTTFNKIEKIKVNSNDVKIYNFHEKGVGLNRNNLLMRAEADICILGDDDMVFKNDYEEIVREYFLKYSDADIIIFNIDEEKKDRFITKKDFKVKFYNYFRFGAARIVFKKDSILFNSIYFNQMFGGGCKFSHGEDTIFLSKCLKSGLKIVSVSESIAKLTPSKSTWFCGYTDKYFMDQGILFFAISKKFYKLLCLQDALRHSKIYGKKVIDIYKLMICGVNNI